MKQRRIIQMQILLQEQNQGLIHSIQISECKKSKDGREKTPIKVIYKNPLPSDLFEIFTIKNKKEANYINNHKTQLMPFI
ncbi:hypothetical protein [Ureibacillus sp. GCM10028918]|uniref:hypothetical protein n=1 Tax=Ureibacillus sp. GCM10028918 TaxID=3273429 RepID=UPI003610B8F0